MRYRRLIFRVLLYLIVFMLSLKTDSQVKTKESKIIIIDPGHGGIDTGAIGVNGIAEKIIVLNVAETLIKLNNQLSDDSFQIYLTRYKDTLVSLKDRTTLAKSLKADVFISLHCNYSDDPEARGSEVYLWNGESDFSRASILLAYHIQKVHHENIGFESRGVKFANFQVLRGLSEFCPAVLVELGFLSHFDEGTFLADKENSSYIALVLIGILREYFEK